MSLEPGTTLLHYRLESRIGEGGMGVVWKAVDTSLDRAVAIKVLPEALAGDVERMARFEREAKLLASLNHPNIATVHGLHEADGARFLAMELVPGEDLAARTARGALPVDEALRIGRQIADALEAAHEQGVIHRDLKPANVMLSSDETVKVLDFGLAKSMEAAPKGADLSNSPTMTSAGTMVGVVLGTAGYMAPEQAKGRAVDRRADVWAFGVVLYEMLTGRRLFDAETVSEVMAAVLLQEPDWERLPECLPAAVKRMLRRCLTKDPRSRLRDIGDARIVLEETLAGTLDEGTAMPEAPAPSNRGRLWLAAGLVAGLALGWAGARLLLSPEAPATAQAYNLSISTPDDVIWTTNPLISADGRTMVFVGHTRDGRSSLYVRNLNETEARPLPGTTGAHAPVLSPDGRSVAFFSNDRLMKVDLAGGDPLTIVPADDDCPGGTWLSDGTILYSPGWLTGFHRVPAEGGESAVVTEPDREAGEIGHWWPDELPGGRHVLFTIWPAGSGINDAWVGVLDLQGGSWERLLPGAYARFAPPDRLIYYRAGTFRSVVFDVERLEIVGESTPLAVDAIRMHPHGSYEQYLAVSKSGALAYIPGDTLYEGRNIVRLDRAGRREAIFDEPQRARSFCLDGDGKRIVLAALVGDRMQLQVRDLERGIDERLDLAGSAFGPHWRPGHDRIAYAVLRKGDFDIYEARSDGSDEKALVTTTEDETPSDWTRDGQTLLYFANSTRLFDAATGTTRVAAENTYNGQLSPDGRWLAFSSESSGRSEVYVQSLSSDAPPVRISAGGGVRAVWCASRDELYFMQDERIMVAPYSVAGSRFLPGPERLVVAASSPTEEAIGDWDLAPDCATFYVLTAEKDRREGSEIRILSDWRTLALP